MSNRVSVTVSRDDNGEAVARSVEEQAAIDAQTPAAVNTQSGLQSRVGGSASRVILHADGTVEEGSTRVVRTTTGGIVDDKVDAAPHDILQTARGPSGRPLARNEINGDTLVNVGGMQVTVRDAIRHGWVDQNELGHYQTLVSGAEAVAMAEGEVQDATYGVEEDDTPMDVLSGDAWTYLNAGTQYFSPEVASSYIVAALSGTLDGDSFQRAVEREGGDASSVAALFDAGVNSMAEELADQMGLDDLSEMANVLEELKTNDATRFNNAIRQLAMRGDAVPFVEHINEVWLKNSDVDTDALQEMGYQLTQGADGSVLVNIDGMLVDVKTARRTGLIRG